MSTPSLPALGVVFALSAPAWAQPADDITDLLARMEAAVLAADAGAYLDCIDRTEPEWAREQGNWAADLAGHTPESFGLGLGDGLCEDRAAGDRWYTADLRISWRLPEGRDQAVEFPARFTESPSGGWLYAGEAWKTIVSADGENVVLYLDEDLHEVARRAIEVMPGVRGHVDEGFETSLDHAQVIKLYGDMGHLQESIYLSYTDPLGGWNEPGEAIKVLADPRMGATSLRSLLAHEYGHVATFTYSPDASNNMPWWAAEGVAELAAEEFTPARRRGGRERDEQVVRRWAEEGQLAEWADMADFRETPSNLFGNVYTQGHQFVGYISERFGRTPRNQWIRLLAEGVPIEGATERALGLPFSDLDAQWRASLVRTDKAEPDEG